MAKLVLTTDRSAEREFSLRSKRLTPTGRPIQLRPLERSVHFLRGVASRASMALPAFHLFHSAAVAPVCAMDGYPGQVLQHSLRFSSLSTVALACRKAFDHGSKGLTGANFAKTTDATLGEHADYWAKCGNRLPQDAYAALSFLKTVFCDCAKNETALFEAASPLGRRIAALKQYADHSAAHLSVENYGVTLLDCAHVVAALTLIGEIVRSFDDTTMQVSYFDSLDEAAFSAARQLFPAVPDRRLFESMKVETQARLCWQLGIEHGRHMLSVQLPYAIGWA